MDTVPAMISEEYLFKLSGRTFQQCAVPLACNPARILCLPIPCPSRSLQHPGPVVLRKSLLARSHAGPAGMRAVALSRYERCQLGHVIAVNCPLDCLIKFVEQQHLMDKLEASEVTDQGPPSHSSPGMESGEGGGSGGGEDTIEQQRGASAPASSSSVAQAVEAAAGLDPGLQKFYAEKYGKSIQDDIVAAAVQGATDSSPSSSASSAGRRRPSATVQGETTAAAAELAAYWQEHAVTHGDVATGGGRELLRYAPTARLLVPMLVGVPGC
jgi:hypothetical protein